MAGASAIRRLRESQGLAYLGPGTVATSRQIDHHQGRGTSTRRKNDAGSGCDDDQSGGGGAGHAGHRDREAPPRAADQRGVPVVPGDAYRRLLGIAERDQAASRAQRGRALAAFAHAVVDGSIRRPRHNWSKAEDMDNRHGRLASDLTTPRGRPVTPNGPLVARARGKIARGAPEQRVATLQDGRARLVSMSRARSAASWLHRCADRPDAKGGSEHAVRDRPRSR